MERTNQIQPYFNIQCVSETHFPCLYMCTFSFTSAYYKQETKEKMKKIYFLMQCFSLPLKQPLLPAETALIEMYSALTKTKEIIKLSSNLGQNLGRMLGSLCNPSPPHPLPSWAAELRHLGKPALQVFENSTKAFLLRERRQKGLPHCMGR